MDHFMISEPFQMLFILGNNLIPECSIYICWCLLHFTHYLKGNNEKKILNLLILHY